MKSTTVIELPLTDLQADDVVPVEVDGRTFLRVPRRWWRNRLPRICLVFLFTTLGTSVGTVLGTAEILRSFF